MNALEMEFEDDTFDLVWACESGEHMPDKAKYVQEMTRVLKPGLFVPWPPLADAACTIAGGCKLSAAPVAMQSIWHSLVLLTVLYAASCLMPHALIPHGASTTAVLLLTVGHRLAGGRIVIATWCQREETPDRPFTPKDKSALQFLYDEWAHPYFVSVQEYGRLLEVSHDYIAKHLLMGMVHSCGLPPPLSCD